MVFAIFLLPPPVVHAARARFAGRRTFGARARFFPFIIQYYSLARRGRVNQTCTANPAKFGGFQASRMPGRHDLQEKLHAAGTGCGARVAGGWTGGWQSRPHGKWATGGGARHAAGRPPAGRRRADAVGNGGRPGRRTARQAPSGDSGLQRTAARAGRGRTGRTPCAVAAAHGGGALQGPRRDVTRACRRGTTRAPRKSAILSAARGPCPRVRAGPPPPRGGPARSSATGRERAGAPAAAGRPHPAEACHAGATAQAMVPPPAAPRAQ